MLFGSGVAAKRLFCALALTAPVILPAAAQERPLNAVLLDRLCAKTMRANEEDRFLGTVSIAVRTTIKYEGGVFSPDLIDDAVQEASQAIVEACPKIAETDDAHRLGVVVGIVHDTTRRLLADGSRRYEPRQLDDATAADLSEELSSQEIDAWLDGLPPRQRALALFLYASDVREAEIASAIGLSVIALPRAVAATKTDLLTFFRQELPDTTQSAERASMQYRIVAAGREPPAGRGPRSRQALAAQGREEPAIENAAAVQAAEPGQGDAVRMRITGISSELYSGWSLLATVSGLPPDRGLDLREPVLLEPDVPGRKRMIAVAADEITRPGDRFRRFLVKAFAIDADHDGSGYRDTFHFGPVVDNPAALRTLQNGNLSTIETARCLWHDYGGRDPGLCR